MHIGETAWINSNIPILYYTLFFQIPGNGQEMQAGPVIMKPLFVMKTMDINPGHINKNLFPIFGKGRFLLFFLANL